ncbi:DUF397 domain-containing protein [Actinokineospora xionganensis]|uniref:DUF397 domain-containing protein n=1 Tax=Actinokineospora xionganensis TaxID=2684470 RepID=A0ABR7LD55_9PSEU|nr:DUF397 domain-containing protein [Actinokineospora xionganensis]MBC6450428.1 DUF397 domain-containing protein [Actinokineospora xionganensis]
MSGEGLVWRKSSRSGNNSNGNCVEVAWRKSSRSGNAANDNCVEVTITAPGIAMRDSKNPRGGQLALPTAGWHAFLTRTTSSTSAPRAH